MADVLSQREVEELLATMTGGDLSDADSAVPDRRAGSAPVPTAQAKKVDSKVILPLHKRRRAEAGQALGDPRYANFGHGGLVSYEPYDFRRPDKLSKENLRSLQMLHESFANYFASSLAGYLRAQVDVEVVSVEQLRYDEYIKAISSSLLNVLNISPLNGQSIFEIDFGILFSMIDRLLGGSGHSVQIGRDLTDIEKVLSENIVHLALTDLRMSWENIQPLEIDVASMDTSTQFVQIVPGNDTVVLIIFEVQMGDIHGAMSMCIPYLLIKPILGKLSAQRWLTNANKKPSPLHSSGLAERLRTTSVPCTAVIGTVDMTVDAVADLAVGQILPMRLASQSERHQTGDAAPRQIGAVDLMIGDQVKFRGKTGLRGKRLAVQIEQVVSQSPDLIFHKEVT